jgi:hypothetical protein
MGRWLFAGLAARIRFRNRGRSFRPLRYAINASGKCWIRERIANSLHHKKRCSIGAEPEQPLHLQRANGLPGTAKQIPCDEPFSQWNMGILKHCADCHGKLLVAFSAVVKTGTDILPRIYFDLPNPFLSGIVAVGANHAIGPANFFEIVPGFFIGAEARLNLRQREVGWRRHRPFDGAA